jgi:hypothetical protein
VEADIVISSTSAAAHVIEKEHVEAAMAARGKRPLAFVDIAVPRDIDPSVASIPNVRLFDIDDLQAQADMNRQAVPRGQAVSRSSNRGRAIRRVAANRRNPDHRQLRRRADAPASPKSSAPRQAAGPDRRRPGSESGDERDREAHPPRARHASEGALVSALPMRRASFGLNERMSAVRVPEGRIRRGAPLTESGRSRLYSYQIMKFLLPHCGFNCSRELAAARASFAFL